MTKLKQTGRLKANDYFTISMSLMIEPNKHIFNILYISNS